MTDGAPLSAKLLRWTARALSGTIVLFWGFFLVAHLLGDEGQASRPLAWHDYVSLSSVLVSLVGLTVAWRWEPVGAAMALVAISICAAVNWKILLSPGTLIPVAALLFLASWWLGRSRASACAARRATASID